METLDILAFGLAWLALANTAAWLAFRHDKHAAAQGDWRLSEAALLGLAALGGSIGALDASRRFRHKTRKQPFRTFLLLIAAVHAVLATVAILSAAAGPAAFEALRRAVEAG